MLSHCGGALAPLADAAGEDGRDADAETSGAGDEALASGNEGSDAPRASDRALPPRRPLPAGQAGDGQGARGVDQGGTPVAPARGNGGRAERKETEAARATRERRLMAIQDTARFKSLKEAMIAAAKHMIGGKNITVAHDPRPYLRAAGRYSALADEALARGDWRDARERAVLNRTASREAVKAGIERDKLLKFLDKYAKRAAKQNHSVSPRYLAQIDATLERFDLRKSAPARPSRARRGKPRPVAGIMLRGGADIA